MMTDRITATHLKRAAIVYVRQSSPEQVRHHGESTRIQVGLRDKAVAYGWRDPVTILDDLGISAGGFAHRAGFQHMAAEVSLGHVGIILCFEASRLSRNSKDWAQLFEVCGHLDTLVADLDQVYDLALPDDRLILGVKGSVSEYELSLFRQRSQAAIVAKAKRGALTFTLPAGLSWTPEGQIELNPDRRVQQAIRMVETEDIRDEHGVPFLIVYGISGNTHRFWSLASARTKIGYEPQDDSQVNFADAIAAIARRAPKA